MKRTHSLLAAWLPFSTLFALIIPLIGCTQNQWYKGNTHTHTWWSDGNAPPELVVKWYREHDYDFLVLSDHNILSENEKWVVAGGGRARAAEMYEQAFDEKWVEKREVEGRAEYRLKTLEEIRPMYEVVGEFLLIQGEEISDGCKGIPVHLNGLNLEELVPPQRGETVLATMQNNIDAVTEQEHRVGRPMVCHLNHPNFQKQIVAEDIAQLKNGQFMEIHNGHPGVRNYGDEDEPSVERMWDIILTRRLATLGLPVTWGVATDDAHDYVNWGVGKANPGRAWVMVRTESLSADKIMTAMKSGDFYATTGVVLEDIRVANNRLGIRIKAEPGVTYTTQFIGTLKGYDQTTRPRSGDPAIYATLIYSDEVGKVLSEQTGAQPVYRFTGDEIYVRAKIISSALHPNPFAEGDSQVAWTQPVQPRQ